MARRKGWRAGDYRVICDRCGLDRMRSQCAIQYNNQGKLLVCLDGCYDEYHPLDSPPKIGPDRQSVPDARPEPEYTTITGFVTADDL